ncbi:MAG: DUF1552 domain-containing protein [Deltaproteobacteria bacterium]|nr:DUF1552 domain-containing protein [Nannocystaceae bacterium]
MTSNVSRRMVLRAAGVAVTLPALVSLLPRGARAGGDTTKRFVSLFFPNGSTMRQDWMLGGSGTDYTMGTAHASLEPLRAKLSMFTNLNGDYGGAPDHSRGTASFLTGAPISDMGTPQVDISIDQAIADALRPATAMRSLHLGPTPYAAGPPSDTGWPSGYNTYVSWSSPSTPNAPLESAQVAFDQVYVPPDADPALAAKRLRLRQSVLDHTTLQIDDITPRLGSDDAQKLDAYLTAVREVESGLQVDPPVPGCGDGAVAPADALDFAEHTRAMLDVIVLAMRCDATRIATYSMDYGFGNKDFTFLGNGSCKHHNLSHSGTTADIITKHTGIVRWYMDQIAYFLGELDSFDDGSGSTLLDDSVVYIGSDVGDGWTHSHANLTAMLAGGGAGALAPGRLIDAAGASYDSVLLGLAWAMGAELPSFSGASMPFAGL